MIYNVAQLMKSQVGTSLTEKIDESEVLLDKDIEIVDSVVGSVRMRRVNQGLLVDGWVELTLKQTCARCLKQFEQPMHITFEERFYPTYDVITGRLPR
jgi:uncharacterized protein